MAKRFEAPTRMNTTSECYFCHDPNISGDMNKDAHHHAHGSKLYLWENNMAAAARLVSAVIHTSQIMTSDLEACNKLSL